MSKQILVPKGFFVRADLSKIRGVNVVSFTEILKEELTNLGIDFTDCCNTATTASGQAIKSGDGTATTFTIAHGLIGATATSKVTLVARSAAAAGFSYATVDATNITVHYDTAPAAAANNITLDWSVSL